MLAGTPATRAKTPTTLAKALARQDAPLDRPSSPLAWHAKALAADARVLASVAKVIDRAPRQAKRLADTMASSARAFAVMRRGCAPHAHDTDARVSPTWVRA